MKKFSIVIISLIIMLSITIKNNTENVLDIEAEELYPQQSINNYGKSEMGKDLTYSKITPKNYDKTILLVFAIHGYEDKYPKDGEVLVQTAEKLIKHYSNEQELNKTQIIIVPCANPDGLYDGNTNNGFGRCNYKGIDLNRDFDANHKVFTNSRNRTLEPFSAKESEALSNLIKDYAPKYVLDFHGWLNYTIGDKELANIFLQEMGLRHKTEFNERCNGYFSYWSHINGAKSLLVEFKNENINIEKLIKSINKIIKL